MGVKMRRAPIPRSILLLTFGLWLYVGGGLLAPLLEGIPHVLRVSPPVRTGLHTLATALYALYSFTCHQLPQRSFFLFGEQPAYTLEELRARVGSERLLGDPWPRAFIGDPSIGWKTALCQRDLAIYGSMALTATAMLLRRRPGRPLPLWAFLTVGLLPIALDGGSQLLSYILAMIGPFTPRESTPLLRLLTGTLFGTTFVGTFLPRLWRLEWAAQEDASSSTPETPGTDSPLAPRRSWSAARAPDTPASHREG
jgi:uncharacterized membrane protein